MKPPPQGASASRVVLLLAVIVGLVWVAWAAPPTVILKPQTTVKPQVNNQLQTKALKLNLQPVHQMQLHSVLEGRIPEIDWDKVLAPDLVLDKIECFPTNYHLNATTRVRITVHNAGQRPTGLFHLRWKPYPGASWRYTTVNNFTPGMGNGFDFNYNFHSATPEIIAEVDCFDEVGEFNESNNTKHFTPVLAASEKDFAVSDIELIVHVPFVGDVPITKPIVNKPIKIRYTLTYNNHATSDTQPATIKVTVAGQSAPLQSVNIAPNTTVRRSVTMTVNSAGPHSVKVEAINTINEANTSNNSLTRTYTWRTQAHPPYKFEYMAIRHYDQIGGGGNLKWALNEGRRFYWKMRDYGHTCVYWAEDTGVSWRDWAVKEQARCNSSNIVYYAGHGNSGGPWYSSRMYDGGTLKMKISNYRFGKNPSGTLNLRWIVWSACETLYDGVQDSSHVNWDSGSLGLSRWFPTFNGLHQIIGNRSLGWMGQWWDWGAFGIRDTRQRADEFVRRINNGEVNSSAWFLANRHTVWDHIDKGFEAAVLSAIAEGTNYGDERFKTPHPDYVGTPSGFNYEWYRIGSPSW